MNQEEVNILYDITEKTIDILDEHKIDYWATDMEFKMVFNEQIKKASYSPYESIIEALAAVGLYYPDLGLEYSEWVSKIATQKFSKFDVVVFVGTNNPNDIFIGETPTQEILIFNKSFQKVFKEYQI